MPSLVNAQAVSKRGFIFGPRAAPQCLRKSNRETAAIQTRNIEIAEQARAQTCCESLLLTARRSEMMTPRQRERGMPMPDRHG